MREQIITINRKIDELRNEVEKLDAEDAKSNYRFKTTLPYETAYKNAGERWCFSGAFETLEMAKFFTEKRFECFRWKHEIFKQGSANDH